MKKFFGNLLALSLSLLTMSAALAQTGPYPGRPVHLIVGFAAGGGVDRVARMLGQKLSASLNQPFVVENRLGASGTVAAQFVVRSAPDGYTLYYADSSHVEVLPFLLASMPYDPLKDLTTVAMTVNTPLVLVAGPKGSAIKSLDDLIRQAKAQPGSIDYASSGTGIVHHIAMEALMADQGIRLTHIPYKGEAQMIPALIGGEVPIAFLSVGGANTVAQSPAGRILAVSSRVRSPLLPNVPSVMELKPGSNFEITSRQGMWAPAGTPPEIVNRLAEATRAALETPDFQAQAKAASYAVEWGSADTYNELMRKNRVSYERVIKGANIPKQ